MKLLKLVKSFGIRNVPRFEKYEYDFYLNKTHAPEITVWSTLSHHETYKKIRNFKSQPYNNFYVLRNKKGFTTIMFVQKYDIIVCDSNGIVIDLLMEIEPGYISEYYENGYFIYFCPVGSINFYSIKIRDLLELGRRWLSDKR